MLSWADRLCAKVFNYIPIMICSSDFRHQTVTKINASPQLLKSCLCNQRLTRKLSLLCNRTPSWNLTARHRCWGIFSFSCFCLLSQCFWWSVRGSCQSALNKNNNKNLMHIGPSLGYWSAFLELPQRGASSETVWLVPLAGRGVHGNGWPRSHGGSLGQGVGRR